MAAYEAVYPRPDGDATVARLALTASEYGYDGLVVRTPHDAMAHADSDHLGAAYDIDIVQAVEIRTGERSRASGLIGRYRDERTIVSLAGGELNRFGVEQDRLDVLAHPMAAGDVNHVIAQAAATNGVRLEFDLGPVLRSTGETRVRAIRDLRKLATLVDKYDVPYVVSAGPRSHLALRAPRELVALGEVVGLGPDAVRTGLAEWGALVARNRERRGSSFIEPGVRVTDDGTDPDEPSR